MRKTTIRLKPNILAKMGLGQVLKKIEMVELEELLKLDYKRGIKVGVAKVTMKEGYNIEDLKWPNNAVMIDILGQEGNTYTIIMKSRVPKALRSLTSKFDMDLIWTKPAYLEKGEIVFSCIGKDQDLEKFVKLSGLIGKVLSVSFNPADYKGHNILSGLTSKQKEVFRMAKEMGYYQYPRKIDGKKLAEVIGISKPTLIEHLRKIENKIMNIVS